MVIRRILHISDIHCYTQNLEEVLEREAASVDAITVGGDLECDGEALQLLKNTGKPVFAVPGNMDDHHIARLLQEYGLSVEGEVIDYQGLIIAGIGGREPVMNIERVSSMLEAYKGRRILVVAHHPPHGHVDQSWSGVHAGLYETLWLIEKYKPIAYLCGHIHEARGVSTHGPTLIVNPGPLSDGYYAIVDLEEKKAHLKRLW